MGMLIEGEWRDVAYKIEYDTGRFVREGSRFRDWVSTDENAQFPVEKDRYHLYVSLACPWAHRTVIFRKLLKLESIISLSLVTPYMGAYGWSFPPAFEDPLNQYDFLHQAYTATEAECTCRVTVPVLWDKVQKRIVNNESSDIIRMMNGAFKTLVDVDIDFYPEELQGSIDELNERIYDAVNNGVSLCGFAKSQSAYEEAFYLLFTTLDALEERLSKHRYLLGSKILECDWRLFVTLIRFDAVYYLHFKCNRNRIIDYPNLFNYMCELYQIPGIAETVDFRQIKQFYYKSHVSINPSGIVPLGPRLDFSVPHNRNSVSFSDD